LYSKGHNFRNKLELLYDNIYPYNLRKAHNLRYAWAIRHNIKTAINDANHNYKTINNKSRYIESSIWDALFLSSDRNNIVYMVNISN
jgi:hypothetical protein